LALFARIDALAFGAHHAAVAGLVATTTVLAVTHLIDAQDGATRFAIFDIHVRAGAFNVVVDASNFALAQRTVERHWVTAQRYVLGDLVVEQGLFGVAGDDQLALTTVGSALHVKEPLINSRGYQVEVGTMELCTVTGIAIARACKDGGHVTIAQFIFGSLGATWGQAPKQQRAH